MKRPECWCSTCDGEWRKAEAERTKSFSILLTRYMILCPSCGNKRCPRATSHANDCTGSNEPGQAGSSY